MENTDLTGGVYSTSETTTKARKFEIVDYSEKSFALFSDSTQNLYAFADKLGNKSGGIGGRLNHYLTDPRTGEKRQGWIFGLKKRQAVEEFIRLNS